MSGLRPARPLTRAQRPRSGFAYPSGYWPTSGNPTIFTGFTFFSPMIFDVAWAFDQASIWVQTVSDGDCVIRLGLWGDDGGFPDYASGNGLIQDLGTVDGTAGGLSTIAVEGVVPAGISWWSVTAQGNTNTIDPLVWGATEPVVPIGWSQGEVFSLNIQPTGYRLDTSAALTAPGAYPATLSGALQGSAIPPLVEARAA